MEPPLPWTQKLTMQKKRGLISTEHFKYSCMQDEMKVGFGLVRSTSWAHGQVLRASFTRVVALLDAPCSSHLPQAIPRRLKPS